MEGAKMKLHNMVCVLKKRDTYFLYLSFNLGASGMCVGLIMFIMRSTVSTGYIMTYGVMSIQLCVCYKESWECFQPALLNTWTTRKSLVWHGHGRPSPRLSCQQTWLEDHLCCIVPHVSPATWPVKGLWCGEVNCSMSAKRSMTVLNWVRQY